MLVVVCARVFVGGLYGSPKRFVGRVVAFMLSGNSLGFRGLGRFGVDYCTFRNLECAILGYVVGRFMNMGNLGCVRARWNFLAYIGVGGTWRGRFAWVETSLCTFVKLRGAFRGIWKLERLVWARKNLGLWRGGELGG